MWHDENTPTADYSACLQLDMSSVQTNLAGPSRPQDRVPMRQLKAAMDDDIQLSGKGEKQATQFPLAGSDDSLHHGDVVIAAITSCTNTSNPR